MSTKQITICDGCHESLEREVKNETYGLLSYTFYTNVGTKVGKYDLCSHCFAVVQNLELVSVLKYMKDEF